MSTAISIPEIGHFALVLALFVTVIQTLMPILGAYKGIPEYMHMGKTAARIQFVLVATAFAALLWSFIVNDFSVAYVVQNSNSALPLQYRVSAVWGAHEGSLLLWILMLSGWTLAVTIYSRSLPEHFLARVIGVLGFISIGFLLFTLLTSNPFDRLIPAALDGRDLNPLLQDPGLIFHPPMLYMGYVGFSVAFSFAIAALLGGHLDATWARWSRPWTTVAWLFLTFGIVLGSWWAYYELGWGGWWFWDPVENASFMPWLAGTALMHSLAVTEKRGAFKSWTVLLAIMAFSLSLLGTFLVRSGVLVSVHAFATDPERGVFILAFLLIVIGSSLGLYAWRASNVRGGAAFKLFSREIFLLSNNVLLVVALATVLMGTLAPLILDALGLGKISVGPPYFNTVFVPIMIPLVILLGIGPLVSWGSGQPATTFARLKLALALSMVLGMVFPLIALGKTTLMVSAAVATGMWAILSTLQYLRERQRRNTGQRGLSAGVYGMVSAHVGMGVFVIGVTLSSAYSIERDIHMKVGDSVELDGYRFRLDSVKAVKGPNYNAQMGQVTVTLAGETVAVLSPEKRTYFVQTMPMTEASIDAGMFRDLYVALAEQREGGGWAMRVYHKPFQRWIWLGGLLMVAGGILAALDRRYRASAKRIARARRRLSASSSAAATADVPA